jgi:hypothetical protein
LAPAGGIFIPGLVREDGDLNGKEVMGMEKARDIDSKFAVSRDGQIYKKSNGEVVPEDEPLFLLRGRDVLALKFLMAYFDISSKERCNAYHFRKLGETTAAFLKFAREHPERMKMPSITEGR